MPLTAERTPVEQPEKPAAPVRRTRAAEHFQIDRLRSRCRRLRAHAQDPIARLVLDEVDESLAQAGAGLLRRPSPWEWWKGRVLDDVYRRIHDADAELVRLTPEAELPGTAAHVLAHAARYLAESDRRRIEAERCATDRGVLAVALAAAYATADDAHRRLRSLRDVLLVVFLILVGGIVVTAAVGLMSPDAMALCFYPPGEPVACPTAGTEPQPGDVLLVLAAGMGGAVLSLGASVRGTSPSGTSYGHVMLLLAVLRLPLGALTAVAGILLIHGGFVPGLTALDTPAQIAAWALFFGAAQHIVSRLFDAQADQLGNRASNRSV